MIEVRVCDIVTGVKLSVQDDLPHMLIKCTRLHMKLLDGHDTSLHRGHSMSINKDCEGKTTMKFLPSTISTISIIDRDETSEQRDKVLKIGTVHSI